jgi:hypothetical protein
VLVSRVPPAQLEWAPLAFKGQLERPACPVPLEPQGQEQLVPLALQEPG